MVEVLKGPHRVISIIIPTLLVIAFILLILVELSLPVIKLIYLMRFEYTSQEPAPASLLARLDLGIWGVCASSITDLEEGSPLSDNGYCVFAQFKNPVPSRFMMELGASDNIMNTIKILLWANLMLHPIAAVLSLTTSITSLFPNLNILSMSLAFLAGILGAAAFGIDVALGVFVRQEIKRLQDLHYVGRIGNGVWMDMVALVFIWIAMTLLCVRYCDMGVPKSVLTMWSVVRELLDSPLSVCIEIWGILKLTGSETWRILKLLCNEIGRYFKSPLGKSGYESVDTSRAHSETLLRNRTRCFLFLVTEAAFIGFALFLHQNPVTLRDNVSNSLTSSQTSNLIKSIFATAFVLWHTVAHFLGAAILFDAYSREWKVREDAFNQRKRLSAGQHNGEDANLKDSEGVDYQDRESTDHQDDENPGQEDGGGPGEQDHRGAGNKSKDEKVDSVSTITSGWLEQMPHFLGRNPTKPSPTFMLAFVASLSMLALKLFGPATIVVDNGTDKWPTDVGGLILGTSRRTHSILNIEHVLGLNLGFGTQPNWIIPKPASNPPGGSIEYTSDLIHFDYSCQWFVPQFSDVSPAVGRVLIGDESFYFTSFKTPPDSTMLDTTTFGTAVYSLLPDSPTTPTSAFIIFGGNSTYPLNSDPLIQNTTAPLSVVGVRAIGNTIDLSGLPTVYNASWFNFSGDRFKASDGRSLVFRAPLATALYCNASALPSTGRVRLASNNLTVRIASPLFPRVYNINDSDIPQYFSWALDGVGNSLDSYVWTLDPAFTQSHLLVDLTALAQYLLLPNNATGSVLTNTSIPPLSLDDINSRMNALVLSASKAQQIDGTEGVVKRDIPAGSGIGVVEVEGPLQRQVLASSLPWLLLTATTALLTFALCCYISYRIHVNGHAHPDKYPQFVLGEVRKGYIPKEP